MLPMIKICRVGSMVHTPFSKQMEAEIDRSFFQKRNITITSESEIEDSNILIAQNIGYLYRGRKKYGFKKKYFLWTHEPRFDTNYVKKIQKFFWNSPIHIMNVYTGDIYINNYMIPFIQHFFRNYWKIEYLNFIDDNYQFKTGRKTVAMMNCQNYPNTVPLIKDGRDIDLYGIRNLIAIKGYERNLLDLYGKDWPGGIANPDFAKSDWYATKKTVLENYSFNLCFENTIADYYCTEKIWDSIRYGCLPIYYGKDNKIYEDFPTGSFIDYCDFNDPDRLFDYIESMTVDEYRERMNQCIEVFNRIIDIRKETDPYQELLDRIVERIYSNI